MVANESKTAAQGYSLLKLDSPNGKVYRQVKEQPVRDARPGEIPIIDVSGIFSDSLADRQAVADQIRKAATTIGFFYIVNHRIPVKATKAASETAMRFFKQPGEKKQPLNAEQFPGGYIGWKGPSTQKLGADGPVDVREGFIVTYSPKHDPMAKEEIPEEISRYFLFKPESFPWDKATEVPNFEPDTMNYWAAGVMLARKLLHSFALSLSLPEEFFDDKVTHPSAAISFNYYPPISPQDDESISIGAHTDFQCFTMLWQDNAGGLQVLTPEGEWVNATPIEGSLVVNIGDYLMRITNDQYVSTVHRARNTSGRERLSIPFFFGFNLNETCGVLPSCVDEKNPAKYEDISCIDWVTQRVKSSFAVDSD